MKIYRSKAHGDDYIRVVNDDMTAGMFAPLALIEAPELDTVCYAPDSLNDTYIEWTWGECPADYAFLDRGMVYLSQRDAEERADFDIKLAGFVK